MTGLLFQLSCSRGGLPMFELVDSQPSHMVSVDTLNLTPGKETPSAHLQPKTSNIT